MAGANGDLVDVNGVETPLTFTQENGAATLVTNQISTLASAASQMLAAARTAIANVSGAPLDLNFGALSIPDLDIDLNTEIPTAPTAPVIAVGGGVAPELSATPPTVTDIPAPTYTDPEEPAYEGGDIEDVGDAPATDLAPLLARIDKLLNTEIPVFDVPPDVFIPTFTDTMQRFDIALPSSIFAYTEEPYDSERVENLTARFLAILRNGGTGLNEFWEAAMWERARDRVRDEHEKQRRQAGETLSGLGWEIPPGAWLEFQTEANSRRNRDVFQVNHELTIENARLGQANFHKAADVLVAVENGWCQCWNQIRDRALQAAIAASEDLDRIVRLKVAVAQYEAERFRASADAYKARIDAAVAQMNLYKARVEAQLAQVEIVKAHGQIVTAYAEALKTAIETYRAKVDAARAKVDFYIAKLNGEVSIYQAKWQGITAKIGAYQARLTGKQAEAEVYRAQVAGYEAQVNAYRAKVEASASEATARAQVFSAEAEAYGSEVGATSRIAEATANAAQASGQHALGKAQVAQAKAQADIQSAIQAHSIEIERLKAIAQTTSQLAASIYSAMNIGANMSDGYSKSFNVSYGHQQSVVNSAEISESHIYQEK